MTCLILDFALLLIAAQVVQCQNLPDPCLPGNHEELDNNRRSNGYAITYPEGPICDSTLFDGWYRFTSASGNTMPTTKIDRMRCGTVVPIWMNGEHPDIGEGTNGVVTRKACANFEVGGPQRSTGCEQTVDIGVKNCTTFFVYYLHATPRCPMAYCIDAFPTLTKAPVLSGPEIVGKTFRFVCQFDYAPEHPKQAFEVAWTFNGVTKRTDKVTDPTRSVSMDGTKLKGNLGKKLGCKVRAFYANNPAQIKGPWLESNVYWVGIQPEENRMTISEEDGVRDLTLTSTVPILCQDTKPGEHESCCISVTLIVKGLRPAKLQAAVSCTWTMCQSFWNEFTKEARVPIPLSTNKDKLTDAKGTDLILKFENLNPAPQHGSYLAVFDDYEISPVQIEVLDAEAKNCSVVSQVFSSVLYLLWHDMLNFYNDRNRLALARVGDYTIYQNTQRHFEVQIRTWPCWGGRVTCVCAVAVREYDDQIVIDGCSESYYANGMASPEIKTFRKLRKSVSVMQATDGSKIGVYLPSGSEVLVKGRNGGSRNYQYLNVFLRVPASDKGQGRGICGTFDDSTTNEFTHRGGFVDTMCNDPTCYPEQFTESWRNNHTTSLFRTVPPRLYEVYYEQFCQCGENNQRANCTLRPEPVYQCSPNCFERAGTALPQETHDLRETERDNHLAFLSSMFHEKSATPRLPDDQFAFLNSVFHTNTPTPGRRDVSTATRGDETSDIYHPDD